MKTLVNSLLLLFTVSLLALPVAFSYFFVGMPTAGNVAGVKSVDSTELVILPNLRDFSGYISFNPQGWSNGSYVDTLGLTAFSQKKAVFHNVYTLYNVSKEMIKVQLHLDGDPVDDSA